MNGLNVLRQLASSSVGFATGRKTRLTKRCAALLAVLWSAAAVGQITMPLPGRSLVKLLPDYSRTIVYALNQGNGSVAGTLLALNSTNGAIISEISLDLNPTDMSMTPAGDALYVINTGSRTISKVDLTSFSVIADEAISTPATYSLANPLYVVAGPSNLVYFTDGAWGPEVYSLDYSTGTATLIINTEGNEYSGAGGMVLNRAGNILYIWQQYGWSAGSVNSDIESVAVVNNTTTAIATSPTQNRDPLNTPIFLDGAQQRVFNKVQMVSATNVSVLLTQFSDNIYGISLDGSVAFGPTEVYNTLNGTILTDLPFSATVQTLSGDQTTLFRYNASTTDLVLYEMSTIAPVSGPNLVPTPANGSVVSLPLTNLSWTVFPYALEYDVYFGTNQAQVAAATGSSTQYLGRVTAPGISLSQPLYPGSNYYWRVDVVGFSGTNAGAVWSFTASTLSLSPSQITYNAIAGYSPAAMSLSLTSVVPVGWTAAVTGANWLVLNPAAGTSPTNIVITYNTAALPSGEYTNNIEFTMGALTLEVPVTLSITPLNIVKMTADRQRPYIYALQPPQLSGQDGLLLFINSTTGNIDKTLTIGINPVDLSVNYGEGNLYIASWGETWTYVVNLNSQTLLPSLNLGTDIYKINAGRAGRVVTEGEDQWIAVNVVDTVGGTNIGSFPYPQREGDGEADPTGNYYYHCDNNISDASVHKFDMTTDTPTGIVDSDQHPYGTRNLVLSADGTRLFWNSYVYDTNLNDLGTLGTELYCCTSNGRVAFGASQAIDSLTRLAIYNLPVSSSVSIVDGQNQRFWYFNSANGSLGSVPLSVVQSPSIDQQPAANTDVTAGSPVYLTVTAMGLAPLSYQWTLSGTNVPGATNYFLSLPGLQPSQQGNYQVVVSNPIGSITSTVAQVTVLTAPTIINQSPSTNVLAGRPFTLSVTAAGTAPLTYLWFFENSPISGATASMMTISNAQSGNEGIYWAMVANSVGSATSGVISLRVDSAAPTIVSNPVSQSVPASSNATFSVTAIGSPLLAYQWFFSNAPISGANASQYSLVGIQAGNSGLYQVVVFNSLGSATSTVATLTVRPLAPYFTTQPVGASVSGGSSRTFFAAANGSQPISYQWQHNGTNILGATQSSLLLTNLAFTDSGPYVLLASNIVGVTPSLPAQLTVYQTPTFTQALTNEIVDIGATVVFSPSVLGSPPLGYSWSLNGQAVSVSNSTLTMSNIQLAQSGFFSVTVTNSYGSSSSTARVSVFQLRSEVTAWGDDSGGQTNVPPNLTDIVAVSGGDYHTLTLHHNGTLTAWGYDGDGQTNAPTNALPFVSIASGTGHNLAITETGSVVAWGRNVAGQCNIPATASNAVAAIAAGDSHSMALTGSGTVVAWGGNSFGQTTIPPGLSNVIAIASGRDDCLALLANGTVMGWGYNTYGQASPPANLSNVVAIAGGFLHSAALLTNGTVVAWGDDSFGQTNIPPGLSNVVAIAAGDYDTLALLANGHVVGWGDDTYGQINVPSGLAGVVSIASGNYHGLALSPAPPVLQAFQTSSGLIISWTGAGTLQWAPTLLVPFSNLPTVGSSYTNTDMTAPAKFFRLRR
jgi:hypothetical protein